MLDQGGTALDKTSLIWCSWITHNMDGISYGR